MNERTNALEFLYPPVRDRVKALIDKIKSQGLEFEVFESFRSPQRQDYLYAKGRTRPGGIVTNARAWESYHQYGLAADFVLYIDGQWSWETGGVYGAKWDQLHQLGRDVGLEPLSWEKPHLQLAGTNSGELKAGRFDYSAADDDWYSNLEAAVVSWNGVPSAPPLPDVAAVRPPLPEDDQQPMPMLVTPPSLPALGNFGWHNFNGGREWRVDEYGVYIRAHNGGQTPLRTRGEPITCRVMLDLMGAEIMDAARKYNVPAQIIMMTIATETGYRRDAGFTGPLTFRWEPHVEVRDVTPHTLGDYSAGPMQTLASTARWVIRQQELPYDSFAVAPYYAEKPAAPAGHPLYEYPANIDIGTAEIKQRWAKTGSDPIFVSAAFNAGGLYPSSSNAWGLRSHGDHLDRAAKWYGDACAVLAE